LLVDHGVLAAAIGRCDLIAGEISTCD